MIDEQLIFRFLTETFFLLILFGYLYLYILKNEGTEKVSVKILRRREDRSYFLKEYILNFF